MCVEGSQPVVCTTRLPMVLTSHTLSVCVLKVLSQWSVLLACRWYSPVIRCLCVCWRFSASGLYYSPADGTHQSYVVCVCVEGFQPVVCTTRLPMVLTSHTLSVCWRFSASGLYYSPADGTHQSYVVCVCVEGFQPVVCTTHLPMVLTSHSLTTSVLCQSILTRRCSDFTRMQTSRKTIRKLIRSLYHSYCYTGVDNVFHCDVYCRCRHWCRSWCRCL